MKRFVGCLLLMLLLTPLFAIDFLEKANEVVITDKSVSFTDAAGQILTLNKNPKKVTILYSSLVSLWYEAGGKASNIIGGSSAQEYYLESLGYDPTQDTNVIATSALASKWDIEKIIEDRPDLIICSTAMYGYATIKGPASLANIPVIAVDYDDFSDYLKWFKVFSALNSRQELWQSIALKALDEVNNIINSCPDNEKPTYLCLFSNSTALDANTQDTVICNMLYSLKADNVIKTNKDLQLQKISINLETIYSLDPDFILIQCHAGTDIAQADVKRLYGSNPVWNALRAVKNNNVYYLPRDLFHNKPNSRFAQAYSTLRDILYQ
ncbi:MAG: ABC transporter substrate-binding protein [Sphaerochaetaceae bacterium]|nr:ABC transporter substrate-binding protein [Sphaerochaetaceae bacterium]